MTVTIRDIVNWMERLAPSILAEDWDSVGLQIGDDGASVTRIMTALTLTSDVVSQAARAGVGLIVAHHPLIFRPLRTIRHRTRVGTLVTQLIKENIALYVSHTNLDSAPGGVNDGLANRLGLESTAPLVAGVSPRRFKLVTFVPVAHVDAVREALALAGAGVIGRYSHCSFSSAGWGSFKPMEGADPHIGQVGEIERVEEVRLEMVVSEADIAGAIAALKAVHPYEEVAYDVFALEGGTSEAGIGRVGDLPRPMNLDEFLEDLKDRLQIEHIRLSGARKRSVRRVAVVGGSGGSFVNEALGAGADVLVTGDVDYHDADEARHGGLLVVDAGHFGTEKHVPHDLKLFLEGEAARVGALLDVQVAIEQDVFWHE